jgi:hypothetical protein
MWLDSTSVHDPRFAADIFTVDPTAFVAFWGPIGLGHGHSGLPVDCAAAAAAPAPHTSVGQTGTNKKRPRSEDDGDDTASEAVALPTTDKFFKPSALMVPGAAVKERWGQWWKRWKHACLLLVVSDYKYTFGENGTLERPSRCVFTVKDGKTKEHMTVTLDTDNFIRVEGGCEKGFVQDLESPCTRLLATLIAVAIVGPLQKPLNQWMATWTWHPASSSATSSSATAAADRFPGFLDLVEHIVDRDAYRKKSKKRSEEFDGDKEEAAASASLDGGTTPQPATLI